MLVLEGGSARPTRNPAFSAVLTSATKGMQPNCQTPSETANKHINSGGSRLVTPAVRFLPASGQGWGFSKNPSSVGNHFPKQLFCNFPKVVFLQAGKLRTHGFRNEIIHSTIPDHGMKPPVQLESGFLAFRNLGFGKKPGSVQLET